MTWASQVGLMLAALRRKGKSFDEAWAFTMSAVPPDPDIHTRVTGFARKHFRAAYERDESPDGRLRVEASDVARMVSVGQQARALRETRCKSGDDCARVATRGRWAPRFCEMHGAELERLHCAVDLTRKGAGIPGARRAA